MADCSDNGLSSFVGLRGRKRGVQAFGALPPKTSPASCKTVGIVTVCMVSELGVGAPIHQWHMDLDREHEQSRAPYG